MFSSWRLCSALYCSCASWRCRAWWHHCAHCRFLHPSSPLGVRLPGYTNFVTRDASFILVIFTDIWYVEVLSAMVTIFHVVGDAELGGCCFPMSERVVPAWYSSSPIMETIRDGLDDKPCWVPHERDLFLFPLFYRWSQWYEYWDHRLVNKGDILELEWKSD